jgi:hypothetical protein
MLEPEAVLVPGAVVDEVVVGAELAAPWAVVECDELPHAPIARKAGSSPRSATRRLTFLA